MRFLFLLLLLGLICCCSNGNKQKMDDMVQKIDSLEKVSSNRQADLANLTSFIDMLSDGLDSIAQQENMLFYTNKGKEGTIVDRKQLKKNIEMFAETIKNQRIRISELMETIKKRGANINKLNKLVNYLNQQLDEKEKMIKELRIDLEKKNVDIAYLKNNVVQLSNDNEKLNEMINRQTQVLIAQNNAINEAYVIIGSKKDLINAGVISGGFLKKTKVNYNNLSKELFKTLDIRKDKEISIESVKPRVLSQMPSSSYELIKEGNEKTILRITDPTLFWSVSNFLIIQTK